MCVMVDVFVGEGVEVRVGVIEGVFVGGVSCPVEVLSA